MTGWTEYNEWLEHGIQKGWISIPVCDTHDGVPMTEQEMDQWDAEHDICIPVVRLYGHEIVFDGPDDIEEKHPVL